MSTSDIQKVQQAQLHSTLWDMANNLRGSMEAYEFKSYILGLIFYRYLSEKVEKNAYLLLKNDNNTLPLRKNDKVAVFGRSAFNY